MDIFLNSDVTLGPMLATFLLGFSTILLLYWYSARKQSYWKERGVKYVKPVPFLGSIIENTNKPLQDVELERHKKLGRIYGHYEANRPVISVAEPKLLRNIFVKDFQFFTNRRRLDIGDPIADKMVSILTGEDWKRVRTILTPTFTTGKIKRMLSIFKDCASTLVQNFKNASEKGDPIELKSVYGAFTMDVIASSAFSTKIDSHNDPNNKFVSTARGVFTRNVNWRFVLLFLAPSLMKFFRVSLFSPSAMIFFRDMTLQIIEQRKKTGQTRNDFLQLLLDATKEAEQEGKLKQEDNESEDITENYGKDESQQMFKNATTKKSLSHNELVAQCVIFFLAGYDTTASTLSFASYLLALNPECQERAIQEIDEVLKKNKGQMTYEAVQSMKYLDNVISETLRLFPPAVRLERLADEDYELGDTGITVPKGMVITVPVYAMHRDPEFFPEPEKFEPDRFNAEERKSRDQYVYLPFGSGPRNCIGMRFALMEVKVCLAKVLSQFKLKRCAETKVPLDFYKGQGLLQPKDIMIKIVTRQDAIEVQ